MRFNLETSRSERLKILQEARGGGSVNPEFYAILKDHQTSGRLDLRNQTELVGSSWDTEKEVWDLRIKTKGKEEERVEDVDYIICATGSTLDFEQLGFLEGIRRDYPMEMVRGYPRITQDLQWNDELPLFVVGAFAALEVRPLLVDDERVLMGDE
jgi:lysine/ornithine N-monooxygenase